VNAANHRKEREFLWNQLKVTGIHQFVVSLSSSVFVALFISLLSSALLEIDSTKSADAASAIPSIHPKEAKLSVDLIDKLVCFSENATKRHLVSKLEEYGIGNNS
jgi:hypothetical protein